jgi:hypothetical protein
MSGEGHTPKEYAEAAGIVLGVLLFVLLVFAGGALLFLASGGMGAGG